VENSRSPLMWVLSFAVVMTVAAAHPAVALAQDVSPTIEAPPEAAASDREPRTRGLGALTRPDARIAFGVRRGAIQHVVTTSPFADVYGTAVDAAEPVTIVTVHRFGQRGGGVRMLSSAAPTTMRLEPSEQPLRIGPPAPIVWNLADRVRIAFGGSAQSAPVIDTGIERAAVPIGALTIEFGDRKP
jgi:hypothetical protein